MDTPQVDIPKHQERVRTAINSQFEMLDTCVGIMMIQGVTHAQREGQLSLLRALIESAREQLHRANIPTIPEYRDPIPF